MGGRHATVGAGARRWWPSIAISRWPTPTSDHRATCVTETCNEAQRLDLARRMLAAADWPTAIFLASDRMAADVYAAAESLGLEVGRDLSVLGFADLVETAWLRPRLSAMRQDPYAIGQAAAELLLERIDDRSGEPGPRIVRVAPQLVERESTRPAC